MEKLITIGQHPENEVVYSGRYIADFHARLSITPECVTIEDLNTTFGTQVNGIIIQKITPLNPKDRVRIGTQLVNWEDLLTEQEEEDTPIYWQDFFRPTGTISFSTYKYVLLLAIGACCVIPVGVPTILLYLEARSEVSFISLELIHFFWWVTSMIAAYVFLNMTQKVIRH